MKINKAGTMSFKQLDKAIKKMMSVSKKKQRKPAREWRPDKPR